MNKMPDIDSAIEAVESLILKHFTNIPFHNLNLLYPDRIINSLPGGTCSDKTLSFYEDAINKGFQAALHTGYIGGKEIHRLVRLRIFDRIFFVDVGNGWPALKLFPADEEVSYSFFGMKYRTELKASKIYIFHEKQGVETLQLIIDPTPRPEYEVLQEIKSRFSTGIVYPFSNSVRFSSVVNDQFLFLRSERLEIYSKAKFEVLDGISRQLIPDIIQQYFGYDIEAAFLEKFTVK